MIGVWAGLILIVVGAFLATPSLIAVGLIVESVWLVRGLWSQFGLRRLTYERRLQTGRVAVGEEIGLDVTVRNRKILPLPWLEVEDLISDEATIAGIRLEPAATPGFAILRTTWTVSWFERVTRHFRILASRRGLYHFQSVRLRVADLFARDSAVEERLAPLQYRVIPRSVPVRFLVSLSDLPGTSRVSRGLFEDPALFAGVRPYQPGDSLRRIHWKATARAQRPVSRRYEPSQHRELIIAVDVQTLPGPFWMMQYDDELIEELYTAAMSLTRSLITSGVQCGLAANGYSDGPLRSVHLTPSASPAQMARIADKLADLSRWPSLPFRSLLGEVARRTSPRTGILVLTAREGEDFADVLRRLAASGRDVTLGVIGPRSSHAAARARAIGVRSRLIRLSPDWRSAVALDLVG